METKEIINKISDQKNVAEMRTELNELKVLFNSIESTIHSYFGAQDVARKKATELSAKAAELYSISLDLAQEKFKAEEAELLKGRETALEELNTAIGACKKLIEERQIIKVKIKSTKQENSGCAEAYDETNKEINSANEVYSNEIQEFEMGYAGGQITGLRNAKFISSESIIELNKLFNKIIKSKKKIEEAREIILSDAELKLEEELNNLSSTAETYSTLIAKNENIITECLSQIDALSENIQQAESVRNAYKETYDAIVVKLDALRKEYTKEVIAFTSQYEKGSISLENTYFISKENVTELNETLGAKAKEEFAVTEYQEKIDAKLNEGDKVAKQINDLDLKVNTALIEREVCKQVVGAATDKAIEKTTEVAGTVVKGIGKGAKVASNIAKVGLNIAKKEVDSFMKDLSAVASETIEEETETTVENDNQKQNTDKTILGEAVGEVKKFINETDFEGELNEFVDETKKLAEDLGVDKAIEQGKTYVKSLFNKFNNQNNNNDKKDDEE